jgi:hypothetical protein
LISGYRKKRSLRGGAGLIEGVGAEIVIAILRKHLEDFKEFKNAVPAYMRIQIAD